MASATQTYETHRYTPRPTVVAAVLWLAAIVCFVLSWFGVATLGAGLLFLSLCVFVLIAIGRIYTTRLQDRIIRLEMRLRCERLLTPAQMAELDHLTTGQLIALRFASDEELPGLLERAARDRMTPDQIKRAIRTWVPDLHRT
jgi:hypothetical protein